MSAPRKIAGCAVAAAALALAVAPAAAAKPKGSLTQPHGTRGCAVDATALRHHCQPVRQMRGPAPFTGSNAVAVSGRNVYVASADSDTVTVLRRSGRRVLQPRADRGCIGGGPFSGCRTATALDKPTSVAVSPDGKNVYVAAMGSSAVDIMARSPVTGALTQTGCIAARPTPGCATGPGLGGVDVVTVSPDGDDVYAGSFRSGAVVSFARSPGSGALTQTGCVSAHAPGCAPGTALAGVEGLAISADGDNVYAAAAISGAIAVLDRRADGTLRQPPPPRGCLAESTADGCARARVTGGADAVAVSPDGKNVYVAAGLEDGMAVFSRDTGTGALRQLPGTTGCIVDAAAIGCSLGRAFADPEGLAVSPDGKNVYVGAFGSGAVDVFNRKSPSGRLIQKTKRFGCVVNRRKPGCARGRALAGANAIALSPSGGRVYVGAYRADAVAVFHRVTGGGGGGCGCG
jgi:DNA-binding beta-propeller fold protein YncE